MPNSPVPLGEIFADKYRVDRVIGEGGMGVVVAAHHLELDQPVAIKFLLDDIAGSADGGERFRREARAAAKIQSDHVVRVLDVGVLDTGIRYMVMEYMEGRDLADELADRRSFPIGVAAGFILEAIDAVGHAHQVGIVHRDLKPANLFLAKRADGSQRVKVLDFGISKSIGGATASELSLTKTSAWIGSPLYMAPEQMQSARDVDQRADIWSLGAILYELISGRTPYVAESLPQLCNMLITQDPPHIKELCPSIPDGLADVIMGCLVRDREQRIQSTAQVAAVLAKYATTVTGSGMRLSLLDQTELHGGPIPSMPASLPGARLSNGAQSFGAQSSGARTAGAIPDKTNAAWGATDGNEIKPKSRVGLIVAALVLAGAAGFFLASRGGQTPEEESSPVAAGQVSDPSQANAKAPVLEEPAKKPSDASPVLEPEPASTTASEKPEEKPTSVSAAPIAPAPSPRPAQPRPVQPRPSSEPKPAASSPSQPQTSDDFADFGGRR